MNIEAKYADRVSPEHEMAMQAIGIFRQLMGQHREQFEKLLKAESDMQSFGHILDPTLYRDMLYSKNFARQIRLVHAALAFLNEVDAVAAEIETETAARPEYTKS